MSDTPPLPIDWNEQRAFWGRSVYVWQINLASLLAVLFVAFVGFSFASPFWPLLVRQLGVTDSRAVAIWSGILIGLGPMSAVIASPLWGRLADRVGGRLLLMRTVIGFALINVLCAVATSVWHLALLRALMGTLASGLAVVAGLNMLLLYQEPRSASESRRQRQARRSTLRLRDLLATPGFLPILLILFAGSCTDRSYQTLVPLFITSLIPAEGSVALLTGIIVAGGALAATVSANVGSRLVPYFTHRQVLLVALLVSAMGSALMGFSQSALHFGLLRVVVGLSAGGILTLAYGLGGSIIPAEHRASAFGLLNSGSMVGNAVGPIMGGLLAAVDLRGAFLFGTGIFCIGLLAAWRGLAGRYHAP